MKKLLKHPFGLTGMFIITLIVLTALLGNLITPDKTKNANWQCLQICKLPPMSKITFFEVSDPRQQSAWQIWVNGKHDPLIKIPINSCDIKGDTAYLNLYTEDGSNELKDVLALNGKNKNYKISGQLYLLGTDVYGRDIFSRIVIGSRVSLIVGIVTVIIALGIGIFLGLLAGYFRGVSDLIISWLINVIWSLPTILLVVAVSFAIGQGFWQIFIAIGLSSWVEVARVVRGQVFSIREKEYIQAAKVLGFGPFRIMLKHILPNLRSTLIVLAISVFGTAILVESGLSFVGLGLAPPEASWGMMIRENYQEITLDHAYLAIAPGICIMLLVMAFNFVGIALRDVLDINLE